MRRARCSRDRPPLSPRRPGSPSPEATTGSARPSPAESRGRRGATAGRATGPRAGRRPLPRHRRFLRRAIVLVVNTSGTVAGEVDALSPRHGDLVVHLANAAGAPRPGGTGPRRRAAHRPRRRVARSSTPRPGEQVHLGEGVVATLVDATPRGARPRRVPATGCGGRRSPGPPGRDLLGAQAGRSPTGTSTAATRSRDYQTVFARAPGSAEMPSAGTALHQPAGHAAGPVGRRSSRRSLLHTGVSSPGCR